METPGGLTCRKCGLVLADHVHALIRGDKSCEGEFGTREEMLADFKRRTADRSVLLDAARGLVLHPIRTLREIGAGMRYMVARNIEEGAQETWSLEHARMAREAVMALPWWKFAMLFSGIAAFNWGFALADALGLVRLVRYFRKDEES